MAIYESAVLFHLYVPILFDSHLPLHIFNFIICNIILFKKCQPPSVSAIAGTRD